MRKKKKLKVIYESLWDKAMPEQKKEYQKRLDEVYDILFQEITKKYGKQFVNSKTKNEETKEIITDN